MIKPDGEHRVSKTDTYLNVAEAFAYRSTCIKRKYGAVIVKNDVVVSTGYNGSPRGYDNCCDIGVNPSDNSIHRAKPCPLCARMIIQAGIRNVIMRTGDAPGAYVIVPAGKLTWHHD